MNTTQKTQGEPRPELRWIGHLLLPLASLTGCFNEGVARDAVYLPHTTTAFWPPRPVPPARDAGGVAQHPVAEGGLPRGLPRRSARRRAAARREVGRDR